VAQEQEESVPGSPMGVKIESGLIASDLRRGKVVRHLDTEMMREMRLGKVWW
jgi:hypothetical protein